MSVDLWQAAPERTSSLQVWRVEAEAAAYIAGQMAPTPFVPLSLRVFKKDETYDPVATAANIAAALLTGQELGLPPMASLRSIDVVNGTPALRAITLRALVLAAGHDMWLEESTETRAIVVGKRKGSDHEQRSLWTLDRAKALGLDGKKNWKAQRGAMLIARATAECARLIAPEAVLGLPYTAEEIADGIETPPSEVEPVRATRRPRTARRAPAEPIIEAPLPPMDEPELDETPIEPTEVEPDPEHPGRTNDNVAHPAMITSGQRTAIYAALTELGVRNRDDRLAILSGVTGDEVLSTLDLTGAQASEVLDYLAQLKATQAERLAARDRDDEPPIE